MKLNPTTEQFVLHWGEMGTKWGVNRTVAQIHALLYLVGNPMNAEELVETLGVARSNVSNSIKELHALKLVKTVNIIGDRRDYFTSSSDDVWDLAKIIVQQRYERELAPTVHFLEELIATPEFAQENQSVQTRIKQTHHFVTTLSTWATQMIKLPTNTLTKLLKLGASVQKLLS